MIMSIKAILTTVTGQDRIGQDSLMIMLKTTIPYQDAKKRQNALERLSGLGTTTSGTWVQNHKIGRIRTGVSESTDQRPYHVFLLWASDPPTPLFLDQHRKYLWVHICSCSCRCFDLTANSKSRPWIAFLWSRQCFWSFTGHLSGQASA